VVSSLVSTPLASIELEAGLLNPDSGHRSRHLALRSWKPSLEKVTPPSKGVANRFKKDAFYPCLKIVGKLADALEVDSAELFKLLSKRDKRR
jgi:hypothetical protein